MCRSRSLPLVPNGQDARMPAAFRSLDVVRIADEPRLVEDGSAGLDGVIDQVREMDDGTYTYIVACIDEADVETVPGLYGQQQLIATGRSLRLTDADYLAEVRGPLGRRGQSIRVDTEGQVVGEVGYTIIDEAAHHV